MSDPTDLKPVRLGLPPDYHKRLRQLAARDEKPMSQYVRELVQEEIDRREKKKEKSKDGG